MIRILLSRKLGELRMSQIDLARKTGIRPNTILGLYHGYTDRISLQKLDLICKALDCNVGDLLEYVPDDEAVQPEHSQEPIRNHAAT